MKKCKFIELNGKNYVPRPSGWIMGMGRYHWFKKVAGIKTHVAGPEYWEKLKSEGNRKTLVEYHNGKWEIVDEVD